MGSIQVTGLHGLKSGKHGFHIHENGDCSDPGAHFNPEMKKHGTLYDSARDYHTGDLEICAYEKTMNLGLLVTQYQQKLMESLMRANSIFLGQFLSFTKAKMILVQVVMKGPRRLETPEQNLGAALLK